MKFSQDFAKYRIQKVMKVILRLKCMNLRTFLLKVSFPYSRIYLTERKTFYLKLYNNKIKVINIKISYLIFQI